MMMNDEENEAVIMTLVAGGWYVDNAISCVPCLHPGPSYN